MNDSNYRQNLKDAALKMCHEFKYNSLVETVHLLEKGVAFYFAIVAVAVGYVFSVNLTTNQVWTILIGAASVSFLFAIAMLSAAYGVLRGIYDLKFGMKKVDPTTFEIMKMEAYFRRGTVVGIIAAARRQGDIYIKAQSLTLSNL